MEGQLNSINDKMNIISNYIKDGQKIDSTLSIINSDFYIYNKCCKESTDSLLEEILNLNYSLKNSLNQFLYSSFSNFDSLQRKKIKGRIELQLDFNDPLFCDLVSLFKLSYYYPHIINRLDSNIYDKIFKEFNEEGYISPHNIEQLKLVATLANLNQENGIEEKLIEFIISLNDKIKNDTLENYKMLKFSVLYGQIVPNSIGKLLSIESVKSTLFLLDNQVHDYKSEDISPIPFAYQYFSSCILPKYNGSLNSELLDPFKINDNKERIKEMILNDDTIWKDYIRKDR